MSDPCKLSPGTPAKFDTCNVRHKLAETGTLRHSLAVAMHEITDGGKKTPKNP